MSTFLGLSFVFSSGIMFIWSYIRNTICKRLSTWRFNRNLHFGLSLNLVFFLLLICEKWTFNDWIFFENFGVRYLNVRWKHIKMLHGLIQLLGLYLIKAILYNYLHFLLILQAFCHFKYGV
jgi:hypothetical protein